MASETEVKNLLEERAVRVKVAKASDKVFRDECMFSFDSPLSSDGIYTNLTSFQSFGVDFMELDRSRYPTGIYLHQKHTKVGKRNETDGNKELDVPTKLAIGGEDGFPVRPEDKFEIVKQYHVVVFDKNGKEFRVPITSTIVPIKVKEAIEAILNHSGNKVEEAVTAWQEELKETKYAENLVQLADPPKISSSPLSWKCQAENCDKQENLWLNLSDGFIGCGRKNWDGTGGCGAALRHYEATGKQYPLAVKLGTITAEGGDVFSYSADEDDLVTNKHLARHLAHFGINVNNLKKSDKSMNELQVDLNLNYEFDTILESGKKLVPVSGAGRIGFKNLGNSCYMNSVLQLLFALPELKRRYVDGAAKIFNTSPVQNIAEDFATQMAKLGTAVLSDKYASRCNPLEPTKNEDDLVAVELRPSTFRNLVGRGHPDFSTGQQQDAVEYFQYLMDYMDRSEKTSVERIGKLLREEEATETGKDANLPTSSLFNFCFEDRVQCLQSGKVKYVARDDCILQLQIPLERATNLRQMQEYQVREEQKRQKLENDGADSIVHHKKSPETPLDDEKVIPSVSFSACLERTLAPEVIEGFLSSATGKKGPAEKTIRFKSFPRYLLIQMRRFYVAEDWSSRKLDVSVPVPEELSLTNFLSPGLQDGEDLLSDEDGACSVKEAALPQVVIPDANLVSTLISMGFSENGCKRALIATSNTSAEAAMEWILSHMEDADFNDPPVIPDASLITNASYNPEHLAALMAMGFAELQAQCALANTGHDPDRAAEWLFNHMDSLDTVVMEWQNQIASGAGNTNVRKGFDSEQGDFSLVGFISHIGKSTNSGHYVCHIKKDGEWIVFNDDKVALSQDPPLSAGYLYLFRRKD